MDTTEIAEKAMRLALEAAIRGHSDEVPIGAAILNLHGDVLSVASNEVLARDSVSAHAEILALNSLGLKECKTQKDNLIMAVTLEPCPMCAWAIRDSRISMLVYGARNKDYGAAGSVLDLLKDTRFRPQVEVLPNTLVDECQAILKSAFVEIRHNKLR